MHKVSKVFHRQLGIANDEFSTILVKSNRHVEQVSALGIGCGQLLVRAEQVRDLVLLWHQVGVHSVHGDVVVVVG